MTYAAPVQCYGVYCSCALTGHIVYSLVQITFMATVFTSAPIAVIAYTLIDIFLYLFLFILLPFIQLYSTVINAEAAAIPHLLLCYSPVIYQQPCIIISLLKLKVASRKSKFC